jgi:hypothetical protein
MGRGARPTGAQMGGNQSFASFNYREQSPVFALFAAAPTTINDPARGGEAHRFQRYIEHKPTLERQTRREKPGSKFWQRPNSMLKNWEA